MLEASQHDDVTRLRGSTRASRAIDYEVSAYVVRGVLIDTVFPAIGAEFAHWLAGIRLEGALVTHYHEDHAGNLGQLVSRGVPVGMVPNTPGHSANHQVVWDVERDTVFGGDLFIGVKVRIAHPGEDIRTQPVSLRKVAALAPKRFFDAHRGPVERPVESLLAKAQWIDDMIGAIERRADDGWSPRAIEREVLGAGDLTGLISRGDYSKRNLVSSVLASRTGSSSTGDRPTIDARAG